MKTLSARFGLLSHTKRYYIRQIFSYHNVGRHFVSVRKQRGGNVVMCIGVL